MNVLHLWVIHASISDFIAFGALIISLITLYFQFIWKPKKLIFNFLWDYQKKVSNVLSVNYSLSNSCDTQVLILDIYSSSGIIELELVDSESTPVPMVILPGETKLIHLKFLIKFSESCELPTKEQLDNYTEKVTLSSTVVAGGKSRFCDIPIGDIHVVVENKMFVLQYNASLNNKNVFRYRDKTIERMVGSHAKFDPNLKFKTEQQSRNAQ